MEDVTVVEGAMVSIESVADVDFFWIEFVYYFISVLLIRCSEYHDCELPAHSSQEIFTVRANEYTNSLLKISHIFFENFFFVEKINFCLLLE